MAISNLMAYNNYLNPLSTPLTIGQYNTGMFPQQMPAQAMMPSMNVQGHNPMMLMMMNSMKQMQAYIKQLEANVTGGNTPASNTNGGSTTTTGGNGSEATAFTGTHSIDSLAEKHTVDMSGIGEQTLVVDGKHNVVTAATVEGEDGADHYQVGSDNELVITKFGPGDSLDLEGDAADYVVDVKDGAIVISNDKEGIEVTMGVDPALIGDDNDTTMENILTNIRGDDMSLWEHQLLVNYNSDAERTSSDHKVGNSKSHKAKDGNTLDFGKHEDYHTYNIEDVKKKGMFNSKKREDNVYVLQGNQNEFNITGDHGANRFMIGATASNVNIEKFGHDDSLQFVDPSKVDIAEGENGEIIVVDYSTNSTVTIQNATLEDVQDGIGAFDGQDDLSKKIQKQAKNAKWTKLGVSAALTVGSLFVGSGGYGGAIANALGTSAKVGGLISTGIGMGLKMTTGIGYMDLGSMLGDKNPVGKWLNKPKTDGLGLPLGDGSEYANLA